MKLKKFLGIRKKFKNQKPNMVYIFKCENHFDS
jgi:hypothetical protein